MTAFLLLNAFTAKVSTLMRTVAQINQSLLCAQTVRDPITLKTAIQVNYYAIIVQFLVLIIKTKIILADQWTVHAGYMRKTCFILRLTILFQKTKAPILPKRSFKIKSS